MKTSTSTEANRLLKRALVTRLIVTPAVSVGLTVVGVLVANALEKKWDQSSSN